MEKGQLSRAAFMQQIAEMTERMVKKAKEYDRDTIPGDYAQLSTPCPNCGGVVKENYRRYACTGKDGGEGCGFGFGKSPAGRTFEIAEAEQLLRDRRIGPLAGFRSKAGFPFAAEIAIVQDDEAPGRYKLSFDFGDDKNEGETGELVSFADEPLGACPACGGAVHEHGSNYVCARAVPTAAQPVPSCKFKSGKIILQQPIERAQMQKLLATGKTDVLDKFISNRTRRPFKARLAWDADAGKVNFEFEPREGKYPPRKTATAKTGAARAGAASAAAKKASKPAAKTAAKKAPRKTTAASGKVPSATLAAVIGMEPVSRPEAVKKIWVYIKEHALQDPQDKRQIVADDKLRAVFGKERAGMFELAGILGQHLG
jgi:DNA topoisomerase-3